MTRVQKFVLLLVEETYFCGVKGATEGMDRVQGDYMGMLATMINAMALQDAPGTLWDNDSPNECHTNGGYSRAFHTTKSC